MELRRKMKLTVIALCIGVFACVSWVAAPFVGFTYASSKMDWIIASDVTRPEIEENKGFLSSREINQASYFETGLLGYQISSINTIVTYSFLGAFFTVVYNEFDHPLAVINNGMHGRSPM